MKTNERSLRLVEDGELEEYPIARSVRLDGHSFTKWFHHRWLSSSLHILGSYEVQGMARALFDMAQVQSPVGTLPDDNQMLARMLRVDPTHFAELRQRAIGPLHNWSPCVSEGERRLMHPVVLEQIRDALDRREVSALSKEERAEFMRIKRLTEALEDMGCKGAILEDVELLQRMNDWLKVKCRGRRTRQAYEQALRYAERSGWLLGVV